MKKVLVAGATGYLGRYVLKGFIEKGYWVRALVRNPDKLKEQGQFLEPAITDNIHDIAVVDVTKPETLNSVCKDIDIIFSSVGITRQKGRLGFADVDYGGNSNLLSVALKENIEKFIFVSVLNGKKLVDKTPMAFWREKFVDELIDSGLDFCIIRPSGFFSDLSEYIKMANKGKGYVIGDLDTKLNPIHDEDLAKICVEACNDDRKEICIGGPEEFTQKEILRLAFSVVNKPEKIRTIPLWLLEIVASIVKLFNSKIYALLRFFISAAKYDFTTTKSGSHKLSDFFTDFYDQAL